MGDPLAYRWSGINITQDDVPWWYSEILNWLSMVQQLVDAFGKDGPAYRARLSRIIDRPDGDAMDVYKLYESYTNYLSTLDT